ncbi:hypothetical protein [Acidovorax sp. SUPP3434]|uniref:hypothetical protein n=1 Tax=Acidovorax sp. SUPP3434 TaxID=2920880 RepID=UPI0024E0D422|nr:hypothetical protein [Acidovorax sp. SUPP3434]
MLGQYGNRGSGNSAAPAGEMDSTEVIYLPTTSGPMPVAAQINGRLYAIDADHLNTPRRLTNTQGQVVWQWLITGFGEANPTTCARGRYASKRHEQHESHLIVYVANQFALWRFQSAAVSTAMHGGGARMSRASNKDGIHPLSVRLAAAKCWIKPVSCTIFLIAIQPWFSKA